MQSGKTLCGAVWELMQWQRRPKGDHLITAPTYKMLQSATLRKLDAVLPAGWASFNKAESAYTLTWGGKVYCRSLEDPDSIEGITAESVWGDEAGKYAVRAWHNIQARRAATQGPVFFSTTPYGMNWLKSEFYDLALKGLPEYRVVQYRSCDSPYFPREEWERAKRDLPPNVFERKYGGSFTRLEGLIFEDFDADRMVMPMPSVPRQWQKVGGIDAGHSTGHPFAFSIWASPNFLDPKSKIVKVAEYKRSGQLMSAIKQAMDNFQSAYTGPVSCWYMDPSASQEIHELRSMGVEVRPAINDVEWGIEQVAALMRQDRYRLAKDRCVQTIDELSTYARDEQDRIIKENDHIVDGDRYCLATHIGRPRRTMEVH